MFALSNEDAKLTSVNPRAELHGEDKKLACDLNFEITTSNTILDMFDPALREMLYKAADPQEGDQDELDINDEGYLSDLRFRELGKLAWGYQGAGYRMVMAYGISGEQDIILIQTEIDKFKFECKPGGSVSVAFRVIGHPTPEEMGLLCSMIQQQVDLTLEPPSAEDGAQQELDDLAGSLAEEAEQSLDDVA